MDKNLYQPPTSDLESGDKKPQNNIWWKLYFWLSLVFLLLAFFSIPYIETISLFDYIDILLSIFGIFGLFGFAFYKRFGNIVFWRYFFYIALFESVIYVLILPSVGVERFGVAPTFGALFAFEIVYAAIYLWVLNQYAYKRPFIWKSA